MAYRIVPSPVTLIDLKGYCSNFYLKLCVAYFCGLW